MSKTDAKHSPLRTAFTLSMVGGLSSLSLLCACEDTLPPPVVTDMASPAGSDMTGTKPPGDEEASPAQCKATLTARIAQLKQDGVAVDGWSFADPVEMKEITTATKQTVDNYLDYDGHYRPLSNHPGCSVTNLYYDKANTNGSTPFVDGNNDGKWTGATVYGGPNKATGYVDGDVAKIPGYPCAAKQYAQQSEDTSKPIIILVHGNSTRPHTFEKFLIPPGTPVETAYENVKFTADVAQRDQLVEKLIAARYRVVSVDFRTDLVANVDPSANSTTQNAAGNIDHGWATPILQSLIKAVAKQNPSRKISLIGHSLSATVVRDALRRMFIEFNDNKPEAINPFPFVRHVIVASGAAHGVSTYDPNLGAQCAMNKTMRGTIVCEMGSRSNYVQTYFHKALNGPKDLYTTPCADGDYAFGKTSACGGNAVRYYSITMSDKTPGSNYQDFYVSQAASRLDLPGCVVNKLTTLNDYDTSGYFNKGFIANHMGSIRSDAGIGLILSYLKE